MLTDVTLLLAAFLPLTSSQYGLCQDDFSTTWSNSDGPEDSHAIYYKTDPESGCRCKEIPGQLVVCFGRLPCRRFPRKINIPPTVKELRIKATGIQQFNLGDLVNVTHIEILKIDGNSNLTRISSGTFSNMTSLVSLSVSYNENLRVLQEKSFEGLTGLRQLDLVNNAFGSVREASVALSRQVVPNLRILQLSENNFFRIDKHDFEMMQDSRLQALSLILCQIDDIHPQAFLPLTNLTTLRLGENTFNTSVITDVVKETVSKIKLEVLNLCSIGLRKFPPKTLLEAVANSSITHLNLAKNQFETITSDSFPFMPNLKTLDLREVLALNITNDAFTGLPNLRTLLLSGNKLSSIPEGVLLEQLTYLDLQQNSGSRLSGSFFSLFGQRFVNMENLQCLNVSFNTIHAVYNTTFLGLKSLTSLGLRNATLFTVPPLSFVMLKTLIILDLANNPFAKNNPQVLTKEVFEGLDRLEFLFLGGCEISYINKTSSPFQYLKSLKHLGLERNKLTEIDGNQVLLNLLTFDLSDNYLKPWKNKLFGNNFNLHTLTLNNNKIQFITDAMLEDFNNLTKLELIENPVICDCHILWPNDKIISLLINQSIFCNYPETIVSNLTLGEFLLSYRQVCQFRFFTRLSVLLPLIFLILLLGVAGILLFYYRWHLRYWIFLTRLYLSRKGKIKAKSKIDGYTNYLYDAFVSYSNEDRNFVVRLVTMLENYTPFLKLCVYERDFQIGTIISESVLESVAKSRKTLLIVSDSYAKSQWCRWESQMAEHHRLFFQNENGQYVDDSLVLIKLGPVSEAHLTPTLKFLLKTRIYLQWDGEEKKQRVFWDKLRTTLAPPEEFMENTHL